MRCYSVGNNKRKPTRQAPVATGTRAEVTRSVHNASSGGSLAQPFA